MNKATALVIGTYGIGAFSVALSSLDISAKMIFIMIGMCVVLSYIVGSLIVSTNKKG